MLKSKPLSSRRLCSSLGSELVARCSLAMSGRMLQDSSLTQAERISLSYESAYGRIPGKVEVRRASEFLERFEQAVSPEHPRADQEARAWRAFCQALMVSNEFVYLD